MKIYFAPYELQFKNKSSGVRQGTLLKVQKTDGSIGYSDLFPWPEFGDKTLKDQTISASRGEFDRQFLQSLYYADIDAQARLAKKSLLKDLIVPRSHFLFMKSDFTQDDLSSIREKGYRSLKVKVGSNLTEDIKSLNAVTNWLGLKLRFDFNGKLTEELFLEFYEKLNPRAREAVEFIEDAVPFNNLIWQRLNQKLPLALDRHSEKYVSGSLLGKEESPGFDYLVIKPARQDVKNLSTQVKIKLVFMGYLDHPVGQSFAAYEAASWKGQSCDTGLVFHQSYETNKYSEVFKVVEGHLVPDYGIGIGFSDLLEKENWELLYEN